MDPRFRGDDDLLAVVPAHAGTHAESAFPFIGTRRGLK
jgi:hypothetical protein